MAAFGAGSEIFAPHDTVFRSSCALIFVDVNVRRNAGCGAVARVSAWVSTGWSAAVCGL